MRRRSADDSVERGGRCPEGTDEHHNMGIRLAEAGHGTYLQSVILKAKDDE